MTTPPRTMTDLGDGWHFNGTNAMWISEPCGDIGRQTLRVALWADDHRECAEVKFTLGFHVGSDSPDAEELNASFDYPSIEFTMPLNTGAAGLIRVLQRTLDWHASPCPACEDHPKSVCDMECYQLHGCKR